MRTARARSLPTSRKDYGNKKLCNPPGRGLGPLSVQTGDTDVDGFLWFTEPGGSPGRHASAAARSAPPTAVFWPAARSAGVRHADFHITGPAEHLRHDGVITLRTTQRSLPTAATVG